MPDEACGIVIPTKLDSTMLRREAYGSGPVVEFDRLLR